MGSTPPPEAIPMEEPGLMSDPTSGAMYVFCVATIPICAVMTGLRFIATYRSGRPIGWEDWFALMAFVTHFVHCMLGIFIIDILRGREVTMLQPGDIALVGKLIYALVPMFPLNQFFAKFSILFLFHRLFSIRRTFKYWSWGCGAVQVGYSVATFLVSLLSCQPVSKGWNLVEPGYCINHSIFLAASETVNSSVDFVMVILAVVMIQDLKMKLSTKWKLGILFGLGGFAGIIGFVKVGESYGDPGTSSNVTSALWTTIQQAVSVICCCAPIYRSLLPKRGLINSLSRPYGTRTGPSKLSSDSDTSSSELASRRGTNPGAPPADPLASNKREEAWLHLDGSSQRGLAWTDVEASPLPPAQEPQYPSRTVQVEQNVEMV